MNSTKSILAVAALAAIALVTGCDKHKNKPVEPETPAVGGLNLEQVIAKDEAIVAGEFPQYNFWEAQVELYDAITSTNTPSVITTTTWWHGDDTFGGFWSVKITRMNGSDDVNVEKFNSPFIGDSSIPTTFKLTLAEAINIAKTQTQYRLPASRFVTLRQPLDPRTYNKTWYVFGGSLGRLLVSAEDGSVDIPEDEKDPTNNQQLTIPGITVEDPSDPITGVLEGIMHDEHLRVEVSGN